MEEIRQIPVTTKEAPGEEDREIPVVENRETLGKEVEGAGAVATELGEIFQSVKEKRNNRL